MKIHWVRIPAISAMISFRVWIKKALIAMFITFPLTCIGYKWCNVCKAKITPKDEMVTHVITSFAGDLKFCYCKSCGIAMGYAKEETA